MRLELSQSQKMLQNAAREFVEHECPKSLVRQTRDSKVDYSPELWRKMADVGWTNMPFPTEYGGENATVTDMVVLYEQLGRALLQSPHLFSIVCSGLTILRGGDMALKTGFLPNIASGSLVFTLALTEADYGWEPKFIKTGASRKGDSFVLKGTKLFVPCGKGAHCLLVPCRTGPGEDSISLLIVDRASPGLTVIPLEGSTSEVLYEVVFDEVQVPSRHLVGILDQGWPLLSRTLAVATVLQCAEVVGGVEYVMEMAKTYASERIAFGQNIGAFSRVQDRIINIVSALDKARWATYEAAWRLDQDLPARLEVSLAKVLANRAYHVASDEAAHIFAGIGFMRDFDLWLYHRKAWTVENYFGGVGFHKGIIANEILDREQPF